MSKARLVIISALVLVSGAAFAAATTNEGGTYTYSGSPNDNRTTGQTGDQIWNVVNPIEISNFYPGQTDIVDYWQIYTGAQITAIGNDRVMKGNVVFENAVKWTGAQNYVGYTGPTKVILRNGGSLTATAKPILIGVSYESGTTGNATVFMEEPSGLTAVSNNLVVGYTLPGAIWMDGGTLSITNGTLKTGETAGKDGYIRVNGGDVSLRWEEAEKLLIGSGDNYGSLHVSGGTMVSRRTSAASEVYVKVGSGANKAADIYVDGGLLDLWNERLGIGHWNSNVTGARASVTVDGNGRVVNYVPVMGRTGSGNVVALNLNGGRFDLTRGFSTYGNTGNSRYLNFDGGTLGLVYDSRPDNSGVLGTDSGEVVVYPRGATIYVPSGINGRVTTSFRAAEGFGVSEITLTNPGSGYVTAPKVTISGGSGSNATAYAVMNKDRTINRIAVTCRGEGYEEGDAVTVTIASTTGSGAAATATLASNAGGAVRKTGPGIMQQGRVDNAFAGEVEIEEGSLSLDGAGYSSASALRMTEGTVLRPVRGKTSALNRLDVENGLVEILRVGDSGTATVNFGMLSVSNGLALATYTNGLAMTLAATDLTETSSSASPVVNGLVYAKKEASKYRSPSLFQRNADGSLSVVETTSTPGPDANWCPSASISEANAPALDAVNSIMLPLTPPVRCFVSNSGLLEVKSGMILVRRPQAELLRMQVTGGGAFTTRAKGGMFIYGDNYEIGKRSNSQANGNVVDKGNWRRLFGPFADPDSSTPMALTVAGEKMERPELGAQAWLLDAQRFSGGLNLVNGGVFVCSDSGFGASGSPVRAYGYCSISSYNWTFGISAGHPVYIHDGAALIFSPATSNQGNTVASALSGAGDLLTSDINRSGYAMTFSGDHSAFTGRYFIQGHARNSIDVFSTQALTCLADGRNGVGVIETSGSITRAAGTNANEICWKTFDAYASLGYGLRGGFAAYNGDLTVNLGGEGAKLEVGSAYLPEGAVVQLQSQYSDSALTFANGFELGGKTQNVNVWNGKTATFAGAISDEVGGGVLAVEGDLALEGATLEVGTANLSAPMLTVDGTLTLAGTLNIALEATKEELESHGDVTLVTATDGVEGSLAISGNVPSTWTVAVRSNSVVLKNVNGTLMIVR